MGQAGGGVKVWRIFIFLAHDHYLNMTPAFLRIVARHVAIF